MSWNTVGFIQVTIQHLLFCSKTITYLPYQWKLNFGKKIIVLKNKMYSKIGLGEGLQHPLKPPSYKVRITDRQVMLTWEPTPTANSCVISLRCLLEQFGSQWGHVFLNVLRWFIFKDGSLQQLTDLSSDNIQFPEWCFHKEWTFPQMDISLNHIFLFIYIFIYCCIQK